MRILVCGGRDFSDYRAVREALDELKPTLIIHGAARGADYLADRYARENHLSKMVFPADWGTFGRMAGPMRNRQMLDEGKPDMVLAMPGGRGTANMVRQAKERGVHVLEVTP